MRIRKHAFLLLVPLLMAAGLLNSCSKVEDGLSSIIWQINFDLITTTWDVQFIDAATGQSIGFNNEDQVQVTVSGSDQKNILDLAGIRQPVFYSTKGVLALALHPERLSPEAQDPVKFVLHARHPGYFPAEIPVLTYKTGINPIKVYLVNRHQSPENVDILIPTMAGRLVDGRLTDSLTIYTSANMASLQMSSGTEVLDNTGEKLDGNLTFSFSYWEGGTTNGIKTLPGGQVASDASGNAGLIYLACGIFSGITDQNGKAASRISGKSSCTALISRTVYNPSTKTRLTAGESVPVWKMNPETGILESKGTTTLLAFQNKLMATFEIGSPGLFILGWINGNLCPSPLTMHPGILPEYNEIPWAFTVNIFELFENELRFVRTTEISGQSAENCEMRFLPDNSELLFRFESYTGAGYSYYKNPDPILLTGFCESGNPVDFDLLPNPNTAFKKIEVVFIDVEHNNTRYHPKVFPGYYRKKGAEVWQSTFVYNGQAYLIHPMEGDIYEMGINFKGEFHMKEVKVGLEDVVLVEIAID